MSREISPKQIYDKISDKVVGQEEAKKLVCNTLFLHFARYCQTACVGGEYKKSNALLMGPTGCGKTYIVREATKAIRELVGIPICPLLEVDCTELSARGWQGDDLAEILKKFYKECATGEGVFDTGVVFLDEFDKLCKPAVGSGGTDHNRNTQYNLLKMVEGSKIEHFNTNGLLFIFAGNFSEIRAMRDRKPKILGFTGESNIETGYVDYHTELDKAGMATQLVGRTPHVAQLYELKPQELTRILDEHLIPELAATWDFLGKDLKISNKAKLAMVDNCYQRKTGARGLHADLNAHLEGELFDMKLIL